MKEKHMVSNAEALVRQKHPIALQVMTGKGGKLTDDSIVKIPVDLAEPKGDTVEVELGEDLAMRGTSLAHLRALADAKAEEKEVNTNG